MTIFVLLKLDNVSLSLADADVLSHVIGHNCCLADWTCVIKSKECELARKSKTACVFGLLFCLFIVFAGVTRACGEHWGSRTNRNKGVCSIRL